MQIETMNIFYTHAFKSVIVSAITSGQKLPFGILHEKWIKPTPNIDVDISHPAVDLRCRNLHWPLSQL